jgi:hypothetical protein
LKYQSTLRARHWGEQGDGAGFDGLQYSHGRPLLVLADLNMVAFFVNFDNFIAGAPVRNCGVGHDANMHQKNARILDAKVGFFDKSTTHWK